MNIYHSAGHPARPPVNRTPEEEEEFQLSKVLMAEILSTSRSRFWKESENKDRYTSEHDFDIPLMASEMKKLFPLLPDERILKEVKYRIYLHHLR